LAPPPLPYPAVLHPFPALVIGAALAAPAEAPPWEQIRDLPPAGPGFFRAAMVANLSIKPLDGPAGSVPEAAENYSFQWRMDKPRWLPALRNASPRRSGPGDA
jgi:hypothetical protein